MSLDAGVNWNYDPDLLQTDSADGRLARTRLHLGDTNEARPLMGDQEIAYFLSEAGDNEYLAGALAADTLANRFAGMASRTINDLTINYGELVNTLRNTSANLRSEAAKSTGVPWMAAHKVSRKETYTNDTSIEQGAFSKGMHDNPGGMDNPNELRADI